MSYKIFVTGGCRSGKSDYAQGLADRIGERKVYLATSQALDGEMRARIKSHQEKRGPEWETCEEPIEVVDALKKLAPKTDVIMLDCMTLWTTNCLLAEMSDEEILQRADALAQAFVACRVSVVIVSNEVGLGIVPDNKLARRFRDLAGAVNQKIAAAADGVVLSVSGIPVAIKGSLPEV